MPFLLVLDITGMSLCLVLSVSLALMVGSSGFRKPLNRAFIAFALAEAAWAAASFLLRLFLWLGQGRTGLMLELATMSLSLACTFLLLFCARYAHVRRKWPLWVVVGVVLVVEANAVFLFQGKFVFDPWLLDGRVLLYHFSPLGFVGTSIPISCVIFSLILLHRGRRSRENDFYLTLSSVFFLAGFVAGGIAQVHFPVIALTSVAGVAIMGWGIIRRQLFNPLRDLAADLRDRAHQQELVSQISRRTTTLLDLDELLHQAVDLIQSRFEYTAVAILLIDGDELVMKAFTHPYDRETLARLRLKVGREGICGWVAANGTPLVVTDVRRDPRYFPGGTGGATRSELAVPIRRNDRIIGVLDIQSARVHAFRDRDLLTQQTIADQLSSSIDNARLYAEARRRAERLATVNRISAAVGSVLDLDVLLGTVYEDVARLFDADAFFIALYDSSDKTLTFRIQVDEGRREAPVREPLGEGLTSQVITTGKPLLVNDVAHTRPSHLRPKMWGTGKVPASWIGVPMLIGERIIGVMSVQRYDPTPYDADDLLLAGTIADQVAVAVENARLYEEVRLELDVRLHTEKVLRESEEKFRTVSDQSPNMIFICSDGHFVYANPQCELSFECPREELYGTEV
ncbi:MAG TPA: GAF domain-containing protein, partial [Spirochaetia bacterium]